MSTSATGETFPWVTAQTQTPLAYRVHCSCGLKRVWLTYEDAWEEMVKHKGYGHKPCLDGLFE